MVDNGLSKTYTLRLTLKGPCFIGSGSKVGKKEYNFNSRQRVISFYDTDKLMDCIIKNNLIDQFTEYMLGEDRTLYDFFKKSGGAQLFTSALRYEVSCGDAILGTGKQPAEIQLFSRNSKGEVYIPGSSVKGMLRTAITACCLLQDKPNTPKPSLPDDQLNKWEQKRMLQKTSSESMKKLDTELFHLLGKNSQRAEDAVNSIFRGISIADSAPISNKNLILCRKLDQTPIGDQKEINLVRECLRPETRITFPLTIDTRLAGDITAEFIMKAIECFDQWYMKNVFSHYRQIQSARLRNHLFLGGGSGYQSKTVTGEWLGDDALHYIATWMRLQFKDKNPNDERNYGISPHMLKCTTYQGRTYLFGLCEVDIS